jgi:hypothetical protein
MRLSNVFASTKENKSWVLIIFLIFAIYLLIDLVVFQFSPYSGRFSTLVCIPDEQEQVQCTATLYGWKEKKYHTFLASEYKKAVELWHFPGASSDSLVCGLKLLTMTGRFKLVHGVQPCWKVRWLEKRITQHFDKNPSSPFFIIYNGLNYSVYTRLMILIGGGFLLWHKREWLEDRITTRNQGAGLKILLINWLKLNISLKVVLYLIVLIINGAWALYGYAYQNGTLFRVCPGTKSLGWFLGERANPSMPYLIGLYPLMSFTTIQGIIQWKFIRSKIDLSRLWIAAPAIASIALVFGINADTTCGDLQTLQNIPSGFWINIYTELLPNIILYILILGFIQWLTLRKQLSHSIGWILIPGFTSMLVPLGFLLTELSGPMSYLLVIPFLLMLFFAAEAAQAAYLSWLVNKKRKTNHKASGAV